jgi:diketogulonate reductase-like aldo/keto reductase
MKYIRLNNNLEMPILGIGTYPLNGLPLIKTVLNAHGCGYTSFDTSAAYFNEECLGVAIKRIVSSGASQPFITTKLTNTSQRENKVTEGFFNSLKRLGLKKIDLYLMHWPYPDKYLKSWKQMEVLYKEGLIGAIGVCNFHQHHLKRLLEVAEIIPAINQIEIHPLFSQKPLRDYCKDKGIHVQAYSPIARMDPKLVRHPVLVKLSKRHKKTVPQVILRWDIQEGIIALPKSGNKYRIEENIDIFNFELTENEMLEIDDINEDYRVRFNPDTVDYINILKA